MGCSCHISCTSRFLRGFANHYPRARARPDDAAAARPWNVRPRRASAALDRTRISTTKPSRVVIVGPPSELERTRKETGSHESEAGEDGGDAQDDGGDARSEDEGGGLVPSTSARRVRRRRQRRVRRAVARLGRQDPARARAGWESVAPRVEGSRVAARVSRLQPLPWLECTNMRRLTCTVLDINGLDKLTEARFMSLLRDRRGLPRYIPGFTRTAPSQSGAGTKRRSSAMKALSPQAITEPNTGSVDATAMVVALVRTWSWL